MVAKLRRKSLTNDGKFDTMNVSFDLAAMLGLGFTAAMMFWRLFARLEKKVDHVIEHMTTKDACAAHREALTGLLNGHAHTDEGDLVVIRRAHGPIHSGAEEVPRGRYIKLPKASGEDVG